MGSTILLKQHRYPTQKYSWEFPGGAVRSGETPEQAAIRELREETGVRAEHLTMIGRFHPIPALAPQLTTVYVARLTEAYLSDSASEQYVDDIVGLRIFSRSTLRTMAGNGEITDGLTLTSLTLLELSNNSHDSPSPLRDR
jgi:8-oxo-dGTP pyrophosphatase MutT (NUDIX family)